MDPALRRGLWLMAGAIFALSSMDMVAKMVIERDVHTITILAIRSVAITLVLLASLAYRKKLPTLRTQKPIAHLLRGMIGLLAVGGFFSALEYLPLADATVVFFTGTLFVAVLSVVVLKERFGPHRWLAIVAGYIGVAIAAAPEFSSLSIGYLFALVGSLSYAVLFITGKVLSKTESTTSLVFYFNVGVGLVALLLLPLYWTPLTLELWLLILAVSALALIGHLAITQAFSTCEASVLAPIEYTTLLWAISFDYFLWQHSPESHTLLGGCIVVISGLYFLYREQQNSTKTLVLPTEVEKP